MITHASIKLVIAAALTSGTVMLPLANAQANDELYFFVTNKADSRIVKLQVSENNKSWGDFDIGKGIAPGETAELAWSSSTNDEACAQWIRAKFADNSISTPAKFDFCENLDDPIEFE